MNTFHITQQDSGEKLASFLQKKFPEASSLRWIKRAIESKYCKVNQKIEWFPSHRLSEGDEVVFAFEEAMQDQGRGAPVVLYEDRDLFIVDKTPGLTCSQEDIMALFPKKGPLFLAHRLDKGTSGVLVLAKNEVALAVLVEQFASHTLEKKYYALVDGPVEQKAGRINQPIGIKRINEGKVVCSSRFTHRARSALTEWERLAVQENCSYLALYPKTGRTHQLRVHLSEMGHPILGDFDYGRRFRCSFTPRRQLLHAASIQLTHPTSRKPLTLKSPLPQDFRDFLSFAKFAP